MLESIPRSDKIDAHSDALDGDDIWKEHEESVWRAMKASGISDEDIAAVKERKFWKDKISLYNAMAFQMNQTRGPLDVDTVVDIGVGLATCWEKMGKRWLSIESIHTALSRAPDYPRLLLSLGGLLFREDLKWEAEQAYTKIPVENEICGATALFMRGWLSIHEGNHTKAYKLWLEGGRIHKSDDRFNVQMKKRLCWDVNESDDMIAAEPCVGNGFNVINHLNSNIKEYMDVFYVDLNIHEPALSLFQNNDRAAIFRTKYPLLTKQECRNVIDEAEKHCQALRGWGTVRQSNVRTTDVALEDITTLRPFLRQLMQTRLCPLISACFKTLSDGSDLGHHGNRIRIHDAFLVKYDAVNDDSLSLPAHSDTSAISVVFALNGDLSGNEHDTEFCGGGTWYKCLNEVVTAPTGNAVFFLGPLRHAGHPITRGIRYILALFLYIEDFSYGTMVGYDLKQPSLASDSETGKGSYVVYRDVVNQLKAATEMDCDTSLIES